ncbi:hypothetical protein [Thalassotalea mangrovi]|uniref:Uncharacterized protein n=1 Tax=Thalassotalea mangrovi TaxID=2572245 RepID=A0A4U1B6K1_9GAMM|nr:hypothetical protein [Thalassotalea mangrovi]TKB45541.1 hypothetical protein E8M12_08035 [Thalassotalea mangrovi]
MNKHTCFFALVTSCILLVFYWLGARIGHNAPGFIITALLILVIILIHTLRSLLDRKTSSLPLNNVNLITGDK